MEFGILSKIYDAIKGLPKTSGAMNAGEFKEKAIHLGSEEKDITNCVFSVTGKGKLHAAWLGGYNNPTYVEQHRWGLKVVIDDEVVFDVQKKPNYEGFTDNIKTVGFITSNLYLGDNEHILFVAPPNDIRAGICLATFDMLTNNNNNNVGSFDSYGNCDNSRYGAFSMCVIPDKPCTSYTLAGRTGAGISSASISVGSIIPEPLIFNKSVKVYASNKVDGKESSIVRVAYTLEV